MRIKSSLILSVLIPLFVIGCQSQSQTMRFFEGEHPLQRLVQYTSKEGNLSGGGFFLFAIGAMEINGKTETKQIVKFAYKSNTDDTFIINSIPLEKVRVNLKDDAEIPTIKFELFCGNNINHGPFLFGLDCDYFLKHYGPQKIIDEGYILNVTLTVKPSDWPIKIQVPL